MKTAIVTTTIRVPVVLENYIANLEAGGHSDVEFIVVGDLKSPPETGAFLGELAAKSGLPIHWWDAQRQKTWLADHPELDRLLPWNSVQRRNLAYLQAVLGGAERIITIDDDNWTTDDDYLAGHAICGTTASVETIASSRGWFNTASRLVTEPSKPLYHRGFPTCMRTRDEELTRGSEQARVVVNAGFWLDVPDADAMCHVDSPVDVVGYRAGCEGRVAVARGTNMVFNSQNTAFHSDLLPAMYLMPMGGTCGALEVGRYDDIWMSIFVKVIADHLGDLVTVGAPMVRQLRNDHDLIQDMLVEIPAQRITNKLTESLKRVTLTGSDYAACYLELTRHLRAALDVDGYSEDEQAYLNEMYDGMEAWVRISQDVVATAKAG
jgi:hypothetical protein